MESVKYFKCSRKAQISRNVLNVTHAEQKLDFHGEHNPMQRQCAANSMSYTSE
jgi:hypothetical protein